MKSQVVVLPVTALCFLLGACGSESSGASPTSRPSKGAAAAPEMATLTKETLAAVWPEQGSKVYATFPMVVGFGEMKVDGRVAILASGEPVAAGTAVAAGDGVQLFEPGVNKSAVTLPVGKQTVTVQLLDAAGKSMGPDMSNTVTYEVVAAPAALRVFFVEPADGAVVKSPFHMKFGVEGMGMSPADTNQLDKTVGHHHVLVRKGAMFPSVPIPKDETHIHYGKAEQEADLTLEPGEYTLTLQFADGTHRSYGKTLSASIEITVE